jgi:hypothetical protein
LSVLPADIADARLFSLSGLLPVSILYAPR